MIRHLFAQEAAQLSASERMASVAERLHDMGYRYDYDTNQPLKLDLAAAALADGHQVFAVEDFTPRFVHYVMPSVDGLTCRRAVVTRSGPVGELLPDDTLAITLEYVEGASMANADNPQSKLLEVTSVAEFLAQKHPHPIQSAARRIVQDLRQLVAI